MAQLTPRTEARRSPLGRLAASPNAPHEWAGRHNPNDDFRLGLNLTVSERRDNFERYVTGYP